MNIEQIKEKLKTEEYDFLRQDQRLGGKCRNRYDDIFFSKNDPAAHGKQSEYIGDPGLSPGTLLTSVRDREGTYRKQEDVSLPNLYPHVWRICGKPAPQNGE